MPISQVNIPNVKNARVELDLSGSANFTVVTAIQSQITEVNVSGGEFNTTDLAVLDGSVFSTTGDKQSFEVAVTAVFTDGETADLHPLLEDKHGQSNIGIRWAPKGHSNGNRRFVCVGTLFRVMPPNLARNGDVLYQFAIRGDVNGEDISA